MVMVMGAGLNYESKQNYTLTVKITDDDAEAKTAQIIIQINRTRGAGTLDERLLAFFVTMPVVATVPTGVLT
jgi:hypothetical protein